MADKEDLKEAVKEALIELFAGSDKAPDKEKDANMHEITKYTTVLIPTDVIVEVKRRAGNPGTLEEKVKVLRQLKWSREWAEGMCRLVYGKDWYRMYSADKNKCINHMLEVLAQKAFE